MRKCKSIIFMQLALLMTICISVILTNNTVCAFSGFLSEPYELASWTFDSGNENKGLVTNAQVTVSDIYGRTGNALVLSGGVDNSAYYKPSQKGFYGKTDVSFQFAAAQLKGTMTCAIYGMNCDFSGGKEEIFRLEILPKAYDPNLILLYAVYGNGTRTKLGETAIELWNDVNLQIDTAQKTCNLQINAESDILVYWQGKSLLTNNNLNSYCIKEIKFASSDSLDRVYLDSFSVKRSGVFYSQTPVISRVGDVYTSGAKIANDSSGDKRYVTFIAQYKNGAVLHNIVSEFITVPANSSCFVETFLLDRFYEVDEIKAFVWEIPSNKPKDIPSLKNITKTGELYDKIMLNSGFEGVPVIKSTLLSGRYAPPGWGFFNWDKPAVPCVDASIEYTEFYEGEQSVYINASNASQAGWTSSTLSLPVQGIKTVYMVKQSEDYAGNVPSVFITFFDANNKFIDARFQNDEKVSSSNWTRNTYEIISKDYPIGAKYYVINLTTAKIGIIEPNGKLYYDLVESGGIDESEITANVNMVPNKQGSWYVLGDEIKFTSSTAFSPFVTEVKGVIADVNGTIIDDVTIGRESFNLSGWRWTPVEAGYYEIRFYAIVNGLYSIPVYTTVTRTDLSSTPVKLDSYVRNVVVAPAETKIMGLRNPKMAFSYQLDGNDYLKLADKVGFSTARIHAIPWGAQFTNANMAIHTAPGQFDWSKFDPQMDMIKSYGFDIVGNLLYTPKWASPSDSEDIDICVREFATYAPTDMAYLEEFLDALIDRYGEDIDTWEIWNEPHLPGGSVFWSDSPENYVELLKTAYTKIKALQPDSQVWIGGIGARRYLSFYSEILRLGAYPYFDKLAMHGYDVDPWNYNNIAESMGLQPKEWVNTEGHFTLVTTEANNNVFISEKRTAFRLILELLRQFKYDAQLITKFSIYDWNTIDTLAWANENNVRSISDGLFQKTFNIEPRLSAIVMHTFLENIGYNTKFESELKFTQTQQGATLNCDDENIVLIWSISEESEAICPAIRALIGSSGVILDWEGKNYNADNLVMKPYTVYYIKNPDVNELNNLPNAKDEVVYSEYERQKQTADVPTALGNSYTMFNHDTMELNGNLTWIVNDWLWKGNSKPTNYKTKFAAGLCSTGIDFIIDVNDDNFKFDSTLNSLNQDVVQIGIDTLGNGITADNITMTVSWDEKLNKMSIVKTQTPNFIGDIPAGWTIEGEEIANKDIHVTRTGNLIRYYIHINYSELYPYYNQLSVPMRVCVTSYNYDNKQYKGYYEWGSGLAFEVNKPFEYGAINFPSEMLVVQQNNALKVFGMVSEDTPLCLSVITENDDIAYVAQKNSESSGYYEFNVPLAHSGQYTIGLGGLNFEQIYSNKVSFVRE